MAELTPKERLQPSLLDRLTDQEPKNTAESRTNRVWSPRKLRDCVIRDLTWLLNTGHLESLEKLNHHPLVAHSVLNYGIPDWAGKAATAKDLDEMERDLHQAILDYEPRILEDTVRVKCILSPDQMTHNALRFDIEGELWGYPMPEKLYLKTEVDLDTGDVNIENLSS
jgi:type VI secretion system protein ImpF